jgi:hypothetical protein
LLWISISKIILYFSAVKNRGSRLADPAADSGKGRHLDIKCPAFSYFTSLLGLLGFADFEHLGAAGRASTRSRGSLVLHGDRLGILDLPLGPALHAVCFHSAPPIE